MQDLRISLVQGDTRWHDPAGNRAYYGALLAPLAGTTDLVILPETFTSGFSNDAIAQARRAGNPVVHDLHLLSALLAQKPDIADAGHDAMVEPWAEANRISISTSASPPFSKSSQNIAWVV